jgi:tripartite-type tricarboxylate transporter receptor subunit TctC
MEDSSRKANAVTMKRLLLAVAALVACAPALAQSDFPTRPITMLVGFAPGGAADTLARIVAKKLSDNMGQPVVVENKGGAGGNIVHLQVANATPGDGYTILLGSVGPLAISPHLGIKLGYDPLKDLAPLSMASIFSQVLLVHPGVPVKNIPEYVALAKSKSGSIDFASSGVGSIPHLSGELLNEQSGAKAVHVPYKGGGSVMSDLLGGQIASFYASPASAAPYIDSGKVRAIAVTGAKRSPFMPTVPTIAESGYPGVVAENWYAFVTSSRVPRPLLDRWNRELVKALSAPEVKEQLAKHFLEPNPSTREELAAYIKRDFDTWARVIKTAGITAN